LRSSFIRGISGLPPTLISEIATRAIAKAALDVAAALDTGSFASSRSWAIPRPRVPPAGGGATHFQWHKDKEANN